MNKLGRKIDGKLNHSFSLISSILSKCIWLTTHFYLPEKLDFKKKIEVFFLNTKILIWIFCSHKISSTNRNVDHISLMSLENYLGNPFITTVV